MYARNEKVGGCPQLASNVCVYDKNTCFLVEVRFVETLFLFCL